MIRSLSRRQVAAIALVLLLAVGSVGAYTALFVGGAGTEYETPSGLVVETGIDHDVSSQNPFLDNETVEINDVTFSAAGPANVTVDKFTGTRTNVTPAIGGRNPSSPNKLWGGGIDEPTASDVILSDSELDTLRSRRSDV